MDGHTQLKSRRQLVDDAQHALDMAHGALAGAKGKQMRLCAEVAQQEQVVGLAMTAVGAAETQMANALCAREAPAQPEPARPGQVLDTLGNGRDDDEFETAGGPLAQAEG